MILGAFIFPAIFAAAAATECYSPTTNKHIDVSIDRRNLTSPDYPNNYQGDLLCRWILFAGRYVEAVVNVTVVSLDLENSTNCQHDFLKIYRGVLNSPSYERSTLEVKARTQMANLCGNVKTPVSFLSEAAVDIFFYTNNNVTGKGFLIEYRALLDVDEDGREKGGRTDSWGIVVIAVCVVVAGVLGISVLLVCLASRRKPKEVTFDSPFGENLPKENNGGISNGGLDTRQAIDGDVST